MAGSHPDAGPRPWVLGLWALVLFLIWSNSFVAIGYLLGSEGAEQSFDWLGLAIARQIPVGVICLLICLVLWPREAVHVARRRWRRLLLCGVLAVPGYHLALYYGQQHGIAPPIAALETALAPLFLMVLAAAFLGEPLSKRKLAGFALALAGLAIIAHAKESGGAWGAYPLLVAITALAPLSWAFYSALTKPVSRECPPILWAYLTLVFGTLPLLALAPLTNGPALFGGLDAPGWFALVFLALPCTVFGNAVWVWLVKHLPASTVGFTIFLNPPLTTISKVVLAAAFPAAFAFRIVPLEWLGGAVVLVGMAVALVRSRPRAVPTTAGGDTLLP